MSDQGTSATGNGEVSAEDAESLAAQFRPAWELDEAPFTAGEAAPAEHVDALAQTGAAHVPAAAPAEFVAPPPPRTPTFDKPGATQLGIAPGPAIPAPAPATAATANGNGQPSAAAKTVLGMAAPPPPFNAPAKPAVAADPFASGDAAAMERPLVRSERPPAIGVGTSSGRSAPRPVAARAAAADASDEYAVPQKSNMGLIIGVAAVVVALVGVGIAAKFAFGGSDSKASGAASASAATSTPLGAQAKAKDDIPPPKDEPIPAPAASPAGPAATQLSQDIPVMRPGSLPKAGGDPGAAAQPVAPTPPKPQPIAATPVAAPPRAGAAAAPPQPPKASASKPPKGNTSGIVRDSPF